MAIPYVPRFKQSIKFVAVPVRMSDTHMPIFVDNHVIMTTRMARFIAFEVCECVPKCGRTTGRGVENSIRQEEKTTGNGQRRRVGERERREMSH